MMIAGEHLYKKSINCPVCKHDYKTTKLRTRYIHIEKHDSDFCSYYIDEKFNPLLYYVNVCPSCGYSHSDTFSRTFKPYTLENIQQKISMKWGNHDYCSERTLKDAVDTYKLAIY